MCLIATTIKLFVANAHLMVHENSRTFLQGQPPAAHFHAAVTSQCTRRHSS